MEAKTSASERPGWPGVLRIHPRTVFLAAVAWVALAWTVFILADIAQVFSLPVGQSAYRELFNDRPVEWTQWLLLPAAILLAGYTSACAVSHREPRIARFLLLFGAGMGLMLFEDTGDARHQLRRWAENFIDPEGLFGLRLSTLIDIPYFALIAALPVYALVRYGPDIWRSVTARFYLCVGFGFYAMAGAGSGLSAVGDLYTRIGAGLDALLFGGRFPVDDDYTQPVAHFMFVDSVIEESIETIAAAAFLATVLAVGRDLRHGTLAERWKAARLDGTGRRATTRQELDAADG